MAFAQFTYRQSLGHIKSCLDAQVSRLYHLGFRSGVHPHLMDKKLSQYLM
ncbi:DUF4372 domain-containing protein [bacterium]|nr:MAG: DUF4372 domain-containing protein [bacterium]